MTEFGYRAYFCNDEVGQNSLLSYSIVDERLLPKVKIWG